MVMVELLGVLKVSKLVNLSLDNTVGQGVPTHSFRKKIKALCVSL